MTWQPIETAPTDGTDIWLCVPGYKTPVLGYYVDRQTYEHGKLTHNDQGWRLSGRWLVFDKHPEPTHWLPVPETPV